MNKLVSRKRSTQLERQLDSLREKVLPGVPVMHLQGSHKLVDSREKPLRQVTHLSQHIEVKLWTEL
jgi:hypothetical protein